MNTSHILPGYSFKLSTKKRFNKKQLHFFRNGFPVKLDPNLHISADELKNIADVTYDPILTYGTLKKPSVDMFIPNYVKYNGMRLIFKGYIIPHDDTSHSFKEFNDVEEKSIHPDLADETRREIFLVYYLEDDTVKINEKCPDTAHYDTIRKRSRLRKQSDRSDDFHTWRDMDVGCDIDMKYFKIHITCCDEFTRQFYNDHEITLNNDEMPFNKDEHIAKPNNYKVSLIGEKITN
ncbi:hypothetical protein M8J77_005702 [Diaphorina citri]|nr:hypothetical protein M8J77_005702 [Diaphorina citri]